MITATISARSVQLSQRLDAHYFLAPGALAAERLLLLKAAGVPTVRIGGTGGVGGVQPTSRTKRVYAGWGETGVPYLRPYDTFDYLPQPADTIALETADGLVNDPGVILQTCSGRNLGPSTYCDAYLAGFAISDDMLRLAIPDPTMRMYVLAFLLTGAGQSLLRRSKTGGVIDHLSVADLESVEVPLLVDDIDSIASLMQSAVDNRERGRMRLAAAISALDSAQPEPARLHRLRAGWTVPWSRVGNRIDAAYYDPNVSAIVDALRGTDAAACGDLADMFIPGRYKRYYVEPSHGRPILSGRQLLQHRPIGLRHISTRSVDFDEFSLHEGCVAFGAEGRAEERIAFPCLIAADRDGWLANNHVMRAVPHTGVSGGQLFLGLACSQALSQVKALACGSVVDAVYAEDMRRVVVPLASPELALQATDAWRLLAQSCQDEAAAIAALDCCIQNQLQGVA